VVAVAVIISDTLAEEMEIGLTHTGEVGVLTVALLFGLVIAAWTMQLAHGWWRKRGEAT
jgi:hypothetical protein